MNYSGQFFELKNNDHQIIEIYHWKNKRIQSKLSIETEESIEYLIILGANDLTFVSYAFEDNNTIKKNQYITIPYNPDETIINKITNELQSLISEDNDIAKLPLNNNTLFNNYTRCPDIHSTNSYSPNWCLKNLFSFMFLDFLWDLGNNDFFNINGNNTVIRDNLFKYPIITGIFHKLMFYELVLNKSPYQKPNKDGNIYHLLRNNLKSNIEVASKELNDWIINPIKKVFNIESKIANSNSVLDIVNTKKRLDAIVNWKNFIINERNENLFVYKRIRSSLLFWFDTAEEELTILLDSIYFKKLELKHEQLHERQLSKYYLKRYSLKNAIKYFSPFGRILNNLIPFILFFIFVWFIGGWIFMDFLSNPDLAKSKWTLDFSLSFVREFQFKYINITTIIILSFLSIPFFIHIFLIIISIIQWINKRFKIYKIKDTDWAFNIKNKITNISPHIFFPRMSIAIISGWLIFFTAEELIRIDFGLSTKSIIIIIVFVFLVMITFMYNEIKSLGISIKREKIPSRIIMICTISFLISFSIGFFIMPMSAKYVEKSDVLSDFYKNHKSLDSLKYEHITNNSQLIKLKKLSNIFSAFLDISDVKLSADDYVGQSFGESTNQFSREYLHLKESQLKQASDYEFIRQILKERTDQIRSFLKNNPDFQFKDIRKELNLYKTYIEDSINTQASIIHIDLESKLINRGILNKIDSIDLANEEIAMMMDNLNSSESISNELKKASNIIYIKSPDSIAKQKSIYYSIHSKFNNKDEIIDEYYIFPNMLMFRTVLALFIGIFLQLIIQDKSITEPI